jgi:hypothetical protein
LEDKEDIPEEELKQSDPKSAQSKSKQVKFDNLYDMLFDGQGKQKTQAASKQLKIKGDRLDFLDSQGQHLLFVDKPTGQDLNGLDPENIKISKSFKLVNPLPKFQSVPAAP